MIIDNYHDIHVICNNMNIMIIVYYKYNLTNLYTQHTIPIIEGLSKHGNIIIS